MSLSIFSFSILLLFFVMFSHFNHLTMVVTAINNKPNKLKCFHFGFTVYNMPYNFHRLFSPSSSFVEKFELKTGNTLHIKKVSTNKNANKYEIATMRTKSERSGKKNEIKNMRLKSGCWLHRY